MIDTIFVIKCAECSDHDGYYVVEASLIRQRAIMHLLTPFRQKNVDIAAIDRIKIIPYQSRGSIIVSVEIDGNRELLVYDKRNRSLLLSAEITDLLPIDSVTIGYLLRDDVIKDARFVFDFFERSNKFSLLVGEFFGQKTSV